MCCALPPTLRNFADSVEFFATRGNTPLADLGQQVRTRCIYAHMYLLRGATPFCAFRATPCFHSPVS